MSPIRTGELADIPDLPVRIELEYEANLAQAQFWRLIQRSPKLDGEKFLREMKPSFGRPAPRIVEEDGYYSARMPFTYAQDPVEWFLRETGLDPLWPPVESEEHAQRVWRGICEQVGIVAKSAQSLECAARKPWRGVCQEVADFGRDLPSIPRSLLESKDNPGKGPLPHHFNEPSESTDPDEKSLRDGELSWQAKFSDFFAKLRKLPADLHHKFIAKMEYIHENSWLFNDEEKRERFIDYLLIALGAGMAPKVIALSAGAALVTMGYEVAYISEPMLTLISRVYLDTTTKRLCILAEGLFETQNMGTAPSTDLGIIFSYLFQQIEKNTKIDLSLF